MTCALVPAVGHDRHLLRERADHGEDHFPGCGKVVHVARENVRDSHRPPAGIEKAWMFPPKSFFFPEYTSRFPGPSGWSSSHGTGRHRRSCLRG